MAIKKQMDLFETQAQAEQRNEETFDKHIEDTINKVSSLTPTSRTLTLDTELASNMDESKLFDLYRQMDNDSVISAALDLFADNVAQENPKTGHVVSVVSKDKTFEQEINDFLHNVVNIDTESWNIVRSLALYGKVILDTKASNGGAEWAFIEVDKPENIYPLTYGQDTVRYFAVKHTEEKDVGKDFYGGKASGDKANQQYDLEPRDRFIVGFNARKHLGKMKVTTQAQLNKTNKSTEEELHIRGGKSLLEGVVETWQILSTLEDSLFINRLMKSTAFNIVSLDVSNTTNKEATKMMDDVKATFNSSESIDQRAQRYSNRQAPIAVNDYIFIPKKGEKGTVTVEQVGGEVGDINLSDIEYYRNKLFAGLGVLKAYLGFEETTPGGLGENTLTFLDERFSKKVKRLRTSLGLISKQMVEHYWIYSNTKRTLDSIPEFQIELGKISTKEEEANRQTFIDNIAKAESFLSIANAFPDHVDETKLFNYVMQELIGIDITKIDLSTETHDINVSLKQIQPINERTYDVLVERKKPKYKRLKQVNTKNFTESKPMKQIKAENKDTFKELYEDYDIFIETKQGIKKHVTELLQSKSVRQMLGEHTYKDLKNKTKATDPLRVQKSKKITGKYIGYDPDNDVIVFEMTAEDPETNKKEGKPTSYETNVRLNDLLDYIKYRQTGETDLSLVRAAMQGDIAVACECPASKYWGQQYNGTKQGYSLVKNTVEPTRNKQYQTLCKHVVSTLTLLPFWTNTIVKDLRQSGTFVRLSKEDREAIEKHEELETLDNIVELETGKPVETKDNEDSVVDDKDPTHKEKPEELNQDEVEDNDKDKDLKDKVTTNVAPTKKKVKK